MISDVYNKLSNKKEKKLYFFSFITTLYITLFLSILFISKEKYTIYMIINIVLSIIYGFYTIIFFTTSFKELNETIREIKIINNATITKHYLTYIKKENITKYNLNMYKVEFKSLDNKDITLYSLTDIKLDNITYLINTKLDYIENFEVYKNEEY